MSYLSAAIWNEFNRTAVTMKYKLNNVHCYEMNRIEVKVNKVEWDIKYRLIGGC